VGLGTGERGRETLMGAVVRNKRRGKENDSEMSVPRDRGQYDWKGYREADIGTIMYV